MESKTKLAKALGDAELEPFLESLLKEPNLTCDRLKAIAADKGITMSRVAAGRFLHKEYEPYLERMQRAKSLAMTLAQFQDGENTAGTIADAGAAALGQTVFEFMMDLDTTKGTSMERLEQMESLSRVLQRLRAGDVQRESLNLRIKQLEDKAQEAKQLLTTATAGGLSAEGLRMIEEAARLL